MSYRSRKNARIRSKNSNRSTFLVVAWSFSHITMAYAILRPNGVDVGKMELRGPVDPIDA